MTTAVAGNDSQGFRRLNRSGLPAGLADSLLSSLATFLVGLYATHYLGGAGLGLYAVAFSAFLFASMAATQSFFVPAEVENLGRAEPERVALLRVSLMRGVPVAAVCAVAAALLVLFVPSDVSRNQRIALIATLLLTALFSPLQDHTRRVLHQSRRSWTAASLSGFQLLVIVAVLAVGLIAGVSHYLLPFGALAVANAVSLTVGWFASRHHRWTGGDLHPIHLFSSGRWLLVAGGSQFGGGLIAVVMLTAVAGAVYTGRSEAVRVLSQPLFVVAAGIGAVLAPRAMTAAQAGDRPGASVHTRRFLLILVGGAAVYALLFGWTWPWNPLDAVFPAAYEDRGLLLLMIFSSAVGYGLGLHQAQLTAGRREVTLAVISGVAAVTQLAVTAATLSLKAYALVLGLLAAAVVRAVATQVVLRRHYDDARRPSAPTAESATQSASRSSGSSRPIDKTDDGA